MIVTVFRSRLRPEAVEEYTRWATRMSELARAMPGYVSHKVFTAEDGERVTIVEFESEDTHRAWAMHPEHVQAQRKGRADFYETFSLQVCQPLRESRFP
jgi:heme-degrading monooxygenase HmoA